MFRKGALRRWQSTVGEVLSAGYHLLSVDVLGSGREVSWSKRPDAMPAAARECGTGVGLRALGSSADRRRAFGGARLVGDWVVAGNRERVGVRCGGMGVRVCEAGRDEWVVPAGLVGAAGGGQ
ncbi:hypothetical protein Aglo01_27940 [Actinokineospora globicatena]|nr:hypothetical protein Aglo01_27940 [Actinokineospora globicatena]GLW85024.1 hypothetical protein Aglo02_26640 [Actinokineospora globicatena]